MTCRSHLVFERRPLGVPGGLVGEAGDAAFEGLSAGEAQGFLVAGPAEQALAGPEHDREDLQPQLIDQVVLDQRVYELEAAGDDDVPLYLPLQRRDLGQHVAREDCRVVPGGVFDGRGHDVLWQAGQPVRQVAAAGWPPRGEPLIAPPAQQEGPGSQGLVEREPGKLRAVPDQADPAADPEAFVTGRVLDDSVERDVLAHDDRSHFGSPSDWCCQLPPWLAAWVVRNGVLFAHCAADLITTSPAAAALAARVRSPKARACGADRELRAPPPGRCGRFHRQPPRVVPAVAARS